MKDAALIPLIIDTTCGVGVGMVHPTVVPDESFARQDAWGPL
jgi:hypothetical protein